MSDTPSLDPLSREQRSERMGRVRGKDTKPELRVRRLVHGMGYRYRLHARDLPGKPDLVFRKRKKAIFVHGCFWHRHEGCSRCRTPKSKVEFWTNKFEENVGRDQRNQDALRAMGWSTCVVWECELSDEAAVARRLKAFLDGEPGVNEASATIRETGSLSP